MTKEDQISFDNYRELFNSVGWKQFIEDLSGATEDLERSALTSLKDERDLYRLKGRLEGWQFVLNFEQAIRHAEAQDVDL